MSKSFYGEEFVPVSARMAARGETPSLVVRRSHGGIKLTYTVAERKTEDGVTYSVYAEFEDGELRTASAVTDISDDRIAAESFCRTLAEHAVTPLSLEAIYEDMLTPG